MAPPLPQLDFDRSTHHLTVYLSGELDQHTAPPIAERIIRHVHSDDEVIWIDMAAVTFCGSAGVTTLIRLHEFVHGLGATLVLYRPMQQVRRVLEMCGVDQLIDIRGAATAPDGPSTPPTIALRTGSTPGPSRRPAAAESDAPRPTLEAG